MDSNPMLDPSIPKLTARARAFQKYVRCPECDANGGPKVGCGVCGDRRFAVPPVPLLEFEIEGHELLKKRPA